MTVTAATPIDLHVDALTKSFPAPRGRLTTLQNVSFTAARSEFVALVGPSGCGKSTLLRLIAGLLPADSGTINFAGWPQLPKCRLVFQDHALFPWMTVLDNVAFGLAMDGLPLALRQDRARALLHRMGLGEFTKYYPHELSGGMRQRVGIARAWITEPDILLMDEPFRALDAQTRLVMQEELLQLWQARSSLVLYVTHDIDEALRLADRVLVLSGQPGHICEEILVPLARPRDLTGRYHSEIEELKWHIWHILEQAVRQKLRVTATLST